jgi:hypothetical protein
MDLLPMPDSQPISFASASDARLRVGNTGAKWSHPSAHVKGTRTAVLPASTNLLSFLHRHDPHFEKPDHIHACRAGELQFEPRISWFIAAT